MLSQTIDKNSGLQTGAHHYVGLGRLSAHLLHEISNPLTAALLHLDQVSDQDSLNVRSARRSLNYLRRYVEAARKQINFNEHQTTFCIEHEINEVKHIVAPLAKKRRIKLDISKSPHYKIKGDNIKFQQIIANLIINAMDAYSTCQKLEPGRVVKVSLRLSEKYVEISVRDWGEGISAQQLSRLFEPFYSTKTNQGLGIGLSLVKQYVEEYKGGRIKVKSTPKLGTRFIVRLPLKN